MAHNGWGSRGGGNVDLLRCLARGVDDAAPVAGSHRPASDPRQLPPSFSLPNPQDSFQAKRNGSFAPLYIVRDVNRHARRATEQIA